MLQWLQKVLLFHPPPLAQIPSAQPSQARLLCHHGDTLLLLMEVVWLSLHLVHWASLQGAWHCCQGPPPLLLHPITCHWPLLTADMKCAILYRLLSSSKCAPSSKKKVLCLSALLLVFFILIWVSQWQALSNYEGKGCDTTVMEKLAHPHSHLLCKEVATTVYRFYTRLMEPEHYFVQAMATTIIQYKGIFSFLLAWCYHTLIRNSHIYFF